MKKSFLLLFTIVAIFSGCSKTQDIEKTNTTDKTFEGDGFTFTYPEKYTADTKGLWTKEGYESHINPPEACSTCQIPEIEINVITTAQTVENQILADFNLTKIPSENVKIEDKNFAKVVISDMYDVTSYYTKNDNKILSFKVYFSEKDNQELKDILATLKFK